MNPKGVDMYRRSVAQDEDIGSIIHDIGEIERRLLEIKSSGFPITDEDSPRLSVPAGQRECLRTIERRDHGE